MINIIASLKKKTKKKQVQAKFEVLFEERFTEKMTDDQVLQAVTEFKSTIRADVLFAAATTEAEKIIVCY
jgi:uncharacterized protein (DUF4213/DUF364 family)